MTTEGTAPVNPTHHDAHLPPEREPLLADKPDGPGAAMMISAGFAIFVLGLLTVLAEASAGAKAWLQTWEWGVGVGSLAGKTTIASLLYVASLALLWAIWRNKDVNLKIAFYIALALGILGALGTLPTFFKMFAV